MKLSKNIASGCLLALLGTGLAGCQTHTTVIPLRNGYEEVSHPNHALIDEPAPPRVSLQYRGTNDTVTPVWPSLYGVNDVIKGNLVIFVAEKAYVEPDRVTHPRLFAVKSPELPMDITDEVLRRWAKASGKSFNHAVERFNLVVPEEKDDRLALNLEFSTVDKWMAGRDEWPEQSTLLLDWSQVDEILHAVKTNGIEQKDLRWHAAYIGE